MDGWWRDNLVQWLAVLKVIRERSRLSGQPQVARRPKGLVGTSSRPDRGRVWGVGRIFSIFDLKMVSFGALWVVFYVTYAR